MVAPRWEADFERYPLVVLRVVGGSDDVAPDVSTMFGAFEAISARPGRKAVVIDLTHAKPDAERRKRFVEWAKSRWASVRTNVVAVAAVAPGAFQRSMVTAVLWFLSVPVPMEVFSRRDDAIEFAIERLEAAGLKVPPEPARRS